MIVNVKQHNFDKTKQLLWTENTNKNTNITTLYLPIQLVSRLEV